MSDENSEEVSKDREKSSNEILEGKNTDTKLQRSKNSMPPWEQCMMYIGIFIGVYFSSLLRGEQSQSSPIIASIIALILMPQVFEKLNVNPDSPLLVRFGLFVQNGVFWDVLMETIGTKLSN